MLLINSFCDWRNFPSVAEVKSPRGLGKLKLFISIDPIALLVAASVAESAVCVSPAEEEIALLISLRKVLDLAFLKITEAAFLSFSLSPAIPAAISSAVYLSSGVQTCLVLAGNLCCRISIAL